MVPPPISEDERNRTQHRLAPGERITFGRAGCGADLPIAHEGVSRRAGEIGAQGAFWTLSNLSREQTYVVENPEGAGEHIKVGPGRLDAPVPFEFSRIVLPAAGDLLPIEVWAPRHDYLHAEAGGDNAVGDTTAPAFSVDRTKRYFAVLAALCEPACAATRTPHCRPSTRSSTGCAPTGPPRPALRSSGTSTTWP